MGKGLLIIILGSVMTLAIVRVNFLRVVNSSTENAMNYYSDSEARNIGNAMVNMILTRIADDSDYRSYESINKDVIDGSVDYRVIDTVLVPGDTLIMIEVEVDYFGFEKTITSYTKEGKVIGWVPPVVRGAWTANGSLNKTISDMYIDGRNYDLNLDLIPGTGTYGISSSVEFENEENAAIGGTYDSIDYAMSYPESEDIIEEYHDWGGNFPLTPDEILGYPEGTLKTIAQSGAEGSQYVLDPANKIEDELTFPLSGVTYVELTDVTERDFKIIGNGNGGVLIVHGPNTLSRLKGLKAKELNPKNDEAKVCHLPDTENESTIIIDDSELTTHLDHGDFEDDCSSQTWFQGLIITDYSFHHHLDILGAMLQLSPNLEMEDNCNGNEDHWAKYSQEAIEVATKITSNVSGLRGNNPMAKLNIIGFGNGRQKALHWFE